MRLWDMIMVVVVLIGAVLAGAQLARAQDRVQVTLPDLSSLSRAQAESLTREVAQADVITANCPGHAISNGEWALINGTGNQLAALLGLDPTTYERKFYGPAFALLDEPSACDRLGPAVHPLIQRLIEMGGTTKP
ncbi:MAG: hypothetical protein Q4G22_09885 [Paracoccus sp. (in: a-proteobacteria)]|uniref:hypothetical protein n=1 Tax=Paracoccus sp. TaxID=267 RepID=UPI0026DFAEEA|nr:hypothetical protein [Paracoccus sp. (in: a-proteobacteria)]MDO5632137.1 hypothetical protein [Paracoccus sp. (in: a-proteobacteria)]